MPDNPEQAHLLLVKEIVEADTTGQQCGTRRSDGWFEKGMRKHASSTALTAAPFCRKV